MRFSRRLRPLLLGFTLLLTQWLSVAHALEHPALSTAHICHLCGPGTETDSAALLPSMQPIAHAGYTEAAPTAPLPAAPAAPTLKPRARGPPPIL